ncbi:MAG: hypothetical protein AAGD13_02000 [Pseudomonadota bacterium]
MPKGTFGEPIPDPHPPINPNANDGDSGSTTGPFGPNDDNGPSATEADGNSLDPDYYPVEDGFWIFG